MRNPIILLPDGVNNLVDNLFSKSGILYIKFARIVKTAYKIDDSKLNKIYSSIVKRVLLFFGIFFLFNIFCLQGFSQIKNRITKVVIDAGHGGRDPGAVGKNSREKDIVLAVALKTGKIIEDKTDMVEVIYTRKTDEFIELHRRAQIANEKGADLFISIHCNSSKSPQAFGAETYVMGLHKTTDNLDVAKTENAAIYYEEDYKLQYEGFDPNTDEDYILLSMFQSATIDQSINFSSKIQFQFSEVVGRNDRGVKQAGFWVLFKTTMPGILIELGFLSNPAEEKYLLSEQGQNDLALGIYQAFKEFKDEFEETNKDLKPVVVIEKKSEPVPQVFYRVQFASYTKQKTLDFKKFRGLPDIKMYEHEGLFKYTAGNDTSMKKVMEIKEEMKNKGFKDTFIVAFLNDKRIPLDEAKQLSESKQ
jgi:N-acetylmuramoyl-L-alanine amidase